VSSRVHSTACGQIAHSPFDRETALHLDLFAENSTTHLNVCVYGIFPAERIERPNDLTALNAEIVTARCTILAFTRASGSTGNVYLINTSGSAHAAARPQ